MSRILILHNNNADKLVTKENNQETVFFFIWNEFFDFFKIYVVCVKRIKISNCL